MLHHDINVYQYYSAYQPYDGNELRKGERFLSPPFKVTLRRPALLDIRSRFFRQADIQDFNRFGCRINAETRYEIGDEVWLSIKYGWGIWGVKEEIPSRIMRIEPQGHSFSYGCEFVPSLVCDNDAEFLFAVLELLESEAKMVVDQY